MMPITKQDIQNVVDNARNRLMDRMASRQDIQSLRETIRTLTTTLQQSQQLLRQEEYQRIQLVRRAVAMESRMVQLEHELQNMRRAMTHLAQQPNPRVTERVIFAQPDRSGKGAEQRYGYNPNAV